LTLRLYVAGQSPASLRALANLNAICREHLDDATTIEVIDVLEEPLRSLDDGVLVTPTLVRLAPTPVRRVIGDLSRTVVVLDALGIAS
jgi:circadian clock protein KaiB